MNSHCPNPACCRPVCCVQDPPCPATKPIYAFAGISGPSVTVTTGGVNLSLPLYQQISGIDVNADSGLFTIPTAGVYRIVYHINLESPEAVNTRLTRNGQQVDASWLSPVTARFKFSAEVFLSLNPGDTIALQMFGQELSAIYQLGIGATLSIEKVS